MPYVPRGEENEFNRLSIFAWTYPWDGKECRKWCTRRCPRICDYLDGACARFDLTDKQATQVTYDFVVKVMGWSPK